MGDEINTSREEKKVRGRRVAKEQRELGGDKGPEEKGGVHSPTGELEEEIRFPVT